MKVDAPARDLIVQLWAEDRIDWDERRGRAMPGSTALPKWRRSAPWRQRQEALRQLKAETAKAARAARDPAAYDRSKPDDAAGQHRAGILLDFMSASIAATIDDEDHDEMEVRMVDLAFGLAL